MGWLEVFFFFRLWRNNETLWIAPLSGAIRIPLIPKDCCFKIIRFADVKNYQIGTQIFYILSSAIIRQRLKRTAITISKCTSINQKSVYCSFNILTSAELPFTLRADPTSIFLAFPVFRLTLAPLHYRVSIPDRNRVLLKGHSLGSLWKSKSHWSS